MFFEDAIITHLFGEIEYSQHGINLDGDGNHLPFLISSDSSIARRPTVNSSLKWYTIVNHFFL